MRSDFTIQLPPQASTPGSFRYETRFDSSIPPVGINFTFLYGALTASKYATPPLASAGKNFRTSSPNSIACSNSVGVAAPGMTGIFVLRQYSTTFSFRPGETMNRAPESTACLTWSTDWIVPAPIKIGIPDFEISDKDSLAASVRNVTSTHGSPPLTNAFASGNASAA